MTMMAERHVPMARGRSHVDPTRVTRLDDRWLLVEADYPDGRTVLWVVDTDADDGQPGGCGGPCCAPHDQLAEVGA